MWLLTRFLLSHHFCILHEKHAMDWHLKLFLDPYCAMLFPAWTFMLPTTILIWKSLFFPQCTTCAPGLIFYVASKDMRVFRKISFQILNFCIGAFLKLICLWRKKLFLPSSFITAFLPLLKRNFPCLNFTPCIEPRYKIWDPTRDNWITPLMKAF